MKLEICSFSGHKIYPGHGSLYVRADNRVFRFVSSKSESLFLQRKNPRKINWTVVYRRINRKGVTEEITRKKTRRTVKSQRAVAGASLETIKAKREQKPEVRAALRKEAIEKAKAAKKVTADKKKAEKASTKSKSAPKKK
ncbi:60S ribosomal protein L24 [Dimargaris cristalligena]|uniref:Ribosomal protein L24e-domain-containing protein n=1 Tax=Dimargaris cristalligena TaxID=215637 RepID=A0A4P9ZNS0_9FUNG|nr:60S ribosomal protein L24 [Dimargaris cristalligena]RKP34261.1 ribosomal protein L24e-domain-containing protein [Dimargaris cristalligena]|eukprot:RKP34261.1 ribosomal protein L24e-domain-containing protein [Dimargaris cristalligena]